MDKSTEAKGQALREHGAFNSHWQNVTDPLFQDDTFFDRRDLVQVKYEMLRQVQTDQAPVARAAKVFGFSRPTFYEAQRAFQKGGLPALRRRRSGPRKAHKLSARVLQFLVEQKARDPAGHSTDLAKLVKKRFGLSVHPRTIERGLQRRQKKGR